MDSELLVKETSNSQEFIIKNSLIFNGFDFIDNQDVWVKDGKIYVLGTNLQIPESIKIIDGNGTTLMPGLIDMHSHLFSAGAPPWKSTLGNPERTLSANLALGVTSVLDMAAPIRDVSNWENDTEVTLPRFAYAGSIFNVEGGHPSFMIEKSLTWPLSKIYKALLISEVRSIEEAKNEIDEHKEAGVSFIKIVFDEIPLNSPTFDAILLASLVQYAHQQNLKVVAHIGSESNLISCIKADIDLFVHGIYRSNLSEESLVLLKNSKIPVVPTSVVWDQLVEFYDGTLSFNTLERFVLDDEIEQAYNNRPDSLDINESVKQWFDVVKEFRQTKFKIIDAMYKAEVPLFIGSDSPNIGNVAGAAVHKELALWKAHTELPTKAILSAATGLSGKWLEDYLNWKVGQIKIGYDADLLLINGDLRQNIQKSQDIKAVWIGGRSVKTELY